MTQPQPQAGLVPNELMAAGLKVFPCKKDKSPSVPKGVSWKDLPPEVQRWPAPLIGIQIPENCLVIDVDRYKGVTPEDIDTLLGCKLPWDEALIQTTTRGGEHYAFRIDFDCIQDSNLHKLAGFDTRVGGKGYICTGASYTSCGFGVFRLAQPDLLPALPLLARPMLEHVETIPSASPPSADMNDVIEALKFIPPDCGRNVWLKVGMALKTQTEDVTLFDQWSSGQLTGVDTPHNYVAEHIQAQWPGWKPSGDTTIKSLYWEAIQAGWKPPAGLDTAAAFGATAGQTSDKIGLADFLAYMPDHRYIFIPTRDVWPMASVDARIEWPVGPDGRKMKPSRWLDANQSVEQMTWAPGLPELIEGKLIAGGGWIDHPGCTCFNLYRPPELKHGDASQAGPWLEHLTNVYPDDVQHITRWLAHRVQHPEQKLNHALVLGGKHGIGKDTILEPVKMAVGPWNHKEVSPGAMVGRFNPFVKSVILRVSEARDLGNDVDRFTFYDHTKVLIAAPPDVIRVDEKNIREYSVPNLCGVIITTNHKNDGLYLPADDRRHYVAWSDMSREQFDEQYWNRLWQWYYAGGFGNVAAYLASLDLSRFDPKAPPAKTEAFWHIVNAARPPEESELADILDKLGNPDAVTLDSITAQARGDHPEFGCWLADRRNSRTIPHRLEAAGYEPVRNQSAQDGYFVVNGKRRSVYAKTTLPFRDRYAAAARLSR